MGIQWAWKRRGFLVIPTRRGLWVEVAEIVLALWGRVQLHMLYI